MRFYAFGKSSDPVILLLPGTCCRWKLNFGEVIPLLEKHFRVLCVSYNGFDETEDTVFTDMLTETEKIEAYIRENHGSHIRAAYGCSLGGSFVGLLVRRQNIHIDHAISLLHKIVSTGEYPKILQGLIDKKRTPYRDKFMDMLSRTRKQHFGRPSGY